jgi:hypothetical protein
MTRLHRILHKYDTAFFSTLVRKIDYYLKQARTKSDSSLKRMRRRNPRSCKFPTSYILEKFLFMLKTGCTYREACLDSASEHHYSTLFKRVKLWDTLGVLDLIYDEMRTQYLSTYPCKSSCLNVYVDGSNIRNKNGHNHVDYGFKDKGKKGCRITWCVDDNRFPLVMSLSSSKGHDVTELPGIISELDSIPNIHPCINIVGDKAYKMDVKRIPVLKNTSVTIITPPKKYLYKDTLKERRALKEGEIELVKKSPQNKREYKRKVVSEETKKLLKTRLIVENTFATLKQFKKLANRYEKKLRSFKLLISLAMILLGNRVICKLEDKKNQSKTKLKGGHLIL